MSTPAPAPAPAPALAPPLRFPPIVPPAVDPLVGDWYEGKDSLRLVYTGMGTTRISYNRPSEKLSDRETGTYLTYDISSRQCSRPLFSDGFNFGTAVLASNGVAYQIKPANANPDSTYGYLFRQQKQPGHAGREATPATSVAYTDPIAGYWPTFKTERSGGPVFVTAAGSMYGFNMYEVVGAFGFEQQWTTLHVDVSTLSCSFPAYRADAIGEMAILNGIATNLMPHQSSGEFKWMAR